MNCRKDSAMERIAGHADPGRAETGFRVSMWPALALHGFSVREGRLS